ncbi:tRNA (adenosine(37)-N6)-threonylcarbamoyltransferase complex transferase subunit TsaD [Candidatus Saccharibacteria bacterium]|nr:tRNA (adenosine(37)-N6)-threonylcarbamoyltransferase complex transferase subunit TsaD [Candidatus Saccharibacteria bacterium]
MKILGIETSCDETAAAVVEDGVKILSNVVVSQIDIFAEYGGVIPEVAARSHLEVILPVVDKALKEAKSTWDDIDAIAVTHAPGLLGSLLIGTLTARTLAILHNKPLYAVHHLKSHVYANWLKGTKSKAESSSDTLKAVRPGLWSSDDSALDLTLNLLNVPNFPLLALVISGGHTQILYMPRHNDFRIIGTTHDDAIGECFDKVAKILGLPYPGGPSITKAARGEIEGATRPGDPDKYKLPHPKVEGLDFSFSGLKTAVLRAVQKELGVPISYPSHKLKELLSAEQVCDFAASFQKTAVEILVEKLEVAKKKYPDANSVVVAGGVSANQALREALPDAYFPAPFLSGDNGVMVAAACYFEIQSGVKPVDPYKLNIYPRISIQD